MTREHAGRSAHRSAIPYTIERVMRGGRGFTYSYSCMYISFDLRVRYAPTFERQSETCNSPSSEAWRSGACIFTIGYVQRVGVARHCRARHGGACNCPRGVPHRPKSWLPAGYRLAAAASRATGRPRRSLTAATRPSSSQSTTRRGSPWMGVAARPPPWVRLAVGAASPQTSPTPADG